MSLHAETATANACPVRTSLIKNCQSSVMLPRGVPIICSYAGSAQAIARTTSVAPSDARHAALSALAAEPITPRTNAMAPTATTHGSSATWACPARLASSATTGSMFGRPATTSAAATISAIVGSNVTCGFHGLARASEARHAKSAIAAQHEIARVGLRRISTVAMIAIAPMDRATAPAFSPVLLSPLSA